MRSRKVKPQNNNTIRLKEKFRRKNRGDPLPSSLIREDLMTCGAEKRYLCNAGSLSQIFILRVRNIVYLILSSSLREQIILSLSTAKVNSGLVSNSSSKTVINYILENKLIYSGLTNPETTKLFM